VQLLVPGLLGFLVACSANPPAPTLPLAIPIDFEVRADSGFTALERVSIARAVNYLDVAAHVRFRLEFDLEVGTARGGENQIWRVPPDAAVVTALDAQYNGSVFGATVQGHPFKTWLVVERMPSEHLFRHVVEHELLHALGCEHVSDPRAVLYLYTRQNVSEAVELSAADRAEIANAISRR